jgi:hypothetical protein
MNCAVQKKSPRRDYNGVVDDKIRALARRFADACAGAADEIEKR